MPRPAAAEDHAHCSMYHSAKLQLGGTSSLCLSCSSLCFPIYLYVFAVL